MNINRTAHASSTFKSFYLSARQISKSSKRTFHAFMIADFVCQSTFKFSLGKGKKYHSTINSINYRKATCEPIYFVFSLDSIIRRKNKGLHNDSERTHAKVVRFKYFGIEKGLLMIYKNNNFFSSLLPLAGLIVHLNNHFDFTGSVLEMNIDDSSLIKLYIKSLIDRVSYRQPEWESSL